MAYRGEDLDLRTPPARSALSGEPAPSSAYLNGLRRTDYGDPAQPIMVDEVVLEACNYAHEIATAHRAGEVRLEHLVYALTRIDAAIPVLEDHGTRVIALRNDALNLIASAPQISGKHAPRKSEDLEAVLRYAGDVAARREHAGANVEDILVALIDLRPDHPGVVLLRRHMPRRVRETSYRPPRPEAPPLIREPDRTRPRQTSAEALLGTPTDSIQNSRIDALEQALRQLSTQLTNERKSMSGTLQDIQRDLGQRRDDDRQYGSSFGDRMTAIEVSLEQRLSDLARKIDALHSTRRDDGLRYDDSVIDRIASIESSIEQRLADLGRAFNALQDRLQGLDHTITKRGAEPSGKLDITPLQDRMANVERLLQTSTGETSRGWATVADRIKTLEATLFAEEGGSPALDVASINHRLDAIERALSAGGALQIDMAPLVNRLESLENMLLERASDPTGDHRIDAENFNKLETRLTEEIRRTLAPLNLSGDAIERRVGQTVATAMERLRGEFAASLAGQLGERVSTSLASFDPGRHIAPVNDRLGVVERNLSAYAQKVQDQTTSYDQDLGEIQDVLIKLHGHQQTINTSLEQWRTQTNTEIGTIGTRLSAIERLSQRPAQLMETMNGRIDTLYRLVAERVERRNRFVYWLFGTNDWLAASWPERRRPVTPSQN